LWIDTKDLKPGELWDVEIRRALESSIGFLFFISTHSALSAWVRQELTFAGRDPDKLVLPILLDAAAHVPMALASRHWLKYDAAPSPTDTRAAALQIVDAVDRYLRRSPEPRPAVGAREVPAIAAEIAQEVRASVTGVAPGDAADSVFVVHGHDERALQELEAHLTSIGVTPIVLARQSASAQSLFQKFMTLGRRARFAIVLLSADDLGASRLQYDQPSVADRALQFRARQNVILELGFFYGLLTFERVFVMAARPPVFPNFERPSDLDGVVFESMGDPGWKARLSAKLQQHGFVARPA
jgi:predicted nucleotide-binding protein